MIAAILRVVETATLEQLLLRHVLGQFVAVLDPHLAAGPGPGRVDRPGIAADDRVQTDGGLVGQRRDAAIFPPPSASSSVEDVRGRRFAFPRRRIPDGIDRHAPPASPMLHVRINLIA